MRRIALFVTAVITGAALTACAGSSGDEPTPIPAPTTATAVVKAADRDFKTQLKCNTDAGYEAVEIANGSHNATGLWGANYVFEERRGEDYPYDDIQKEVKLFVQPPAGVSVPSAIVHSVDSNDTEYVMNLPAGGQTNIYLKTPKYALVPGHYNNYPISSVTLCIKRSS